MKTIILLSAGLALFGTARAALQSDIEYRRVDGESLKLNAYVPEGAGPFAAVILVHGGGWTAGDKSGGPHRALIAPMEDPLAAAGFAWFSIDYRLAPQHPYPACIDDVEAAIRWVKAHAAEYHVDPARIAIAGESAGGHLVELAAVRADDSTRVAAVVPFYGPGDLTRGLRPGQPLRGNLAALFGRETYDDATRDLIRSASPLFGVKPGLPPFLFVHGTSDSKVAYQQSLDLQAALRAAHVRADLITIKGGEHGMRNWENIDPTYKQQVVDWLKKTLRAE